MIVKDKLTDYWFKIEPFVHITIAGDDALLYNVLDGSVIEVANMEVVDLLKEILQKENCGVVLLSSERLKQKTIYRFIDELLKKYMGDVIDVDLSKIKPVQILPYFNFSDTQLLFKKHNFGIGKKILDYLSEINIHVDSRTSITTLMAYLQSIPEGIIINIIGNLENVIDRNILLLFLNESSFVKNIRTYYTHVISLQPDFIKEFSYSILVRFPIDILQWDYSRKLLLDQLLPYQYIFEVSSLDDCRQVDALVKEYSIKQYQLKPVYTGENLDFFQKTVFLSKEDILSTPMSINDFFVNHSMNIYDFGKINIMPDGEIYANINHPSLGNIQTHSIYEIIVKELEGGQSWLRIRNQVPCNNCIFQWHCPSPSDYEIELGIPNLCCIK
ncbi:TIGR04150 pseudo-rSAM protein [uncultured Parabacteroides sp.]|uniref:TIGR04150 pseudo-rSAM protein n=1 Tax=uncultured Parabacteroides sp. TaxID=512312 RepID=UPI0026353BFD|nr:TIGR04150 pseudo-rSAM protein [uncultured Parabacteroides sp.]